MPKKMTATQIAALRIMERNPLGTCGYELKSAGCGNTGTLHQLAARGYCQPIGIGHAFFPQGGTYRITAAGQAALDDLPK